MTAQLQKLGATTTGAATKLERYIVRSSRDGTFSLASGMSVKKARVSAESLADMAASMAYVNTLMKHDLLVSTPDLDVFPIDPMYGAQSVGSAWYWRWWGVEVHLDAYWTNKLVNALAAGAALAGIRALLCGATGVCGLVAGLAAGVLALGAAVIGFCSNSKGVVIKKSYAGPAWCHGH